MSKVNKISICNAIKKAKIEVKGISEEKETTIDLNVDSDIFPSETFKFANSSLCLFIRAIVIFSM